MIPAAMDHGMGEVAAASLLAVIGVFDIVGTTCSGWLTAEIFGRERVGMVFGWIFCSHMFGAALAAWGAGAIRTSFGGYGWAFGSAGLLCLFAVSLVLQIERRPLLLPAAATA